MKQRVVVTGGTGFVGRALVAALVARGDEVIVLGRTADDPRVPRGVRSRAWTPDRDGPWGDLIDGADAAIHLAGDPVMGGRWTAAKQQRLTDSRVLSTRAIVAAIGRAKQRPRVLVSASAVGYYGPRDAGDVVDESAPAGADFLSQVCQAWEAEAIAAESLGVRVVRPRIGIVLGKGGGALAEMLPMRGRNFVGGPIGSGQQMMPWIHLDDVVGLLLLALDGDVSGPINLTAPNPVPMRKLASSLGEALGRPSVMRVPGFMIKVALGEAAEVLLTGQRAVPKRALALGYRFRYDDVDAAIRAVVG